MTTMLEAYASVTGEDVIRHLQQLAQPLQGKSIVHVNSTRVGGGVAEILEKLVPLTRELGIDARWEVITGDTEFYQCTKSMRNAIQGNRVTIADALLKHFEEVNEQNAISFLFTIRSQRHCSSFAEIERENGCGVAISMPVVPIALLGILSSNLFEATMPVFFHCRSSPSFCRIRNM